MAVIAWPSALRARSMNPHPRSRVVSGGRSLAGIEQRVASDAGYWSLSIDGIRVNTRERAAAYRWLISRLRADDEVVVPVCDVYKPVGARGTASSITLSSSAALRATTLALTVSGVDIEVGHYFSIANKLYMIDAILSGPTDSLLINPIATDTNFLDEPWTDSVSGSVAYSVSIFPPLRSSASSGAAVTFNNLAMTCRLDDISSGDLELDLGRFGSPSLSLVEAL